MNFIRKLFTNKKTVPVLFIALILSMFINIFAAPGFVQKKSETVHVLFVHYDDGYYNVSFYREDAIPPEKIDVQIWQDGDSLSTVTYTK